MVPGPQPSEKPVSRTKGPQTKLITCGDAAKLVAGYAFSEVKPTKCSGSTYEFEARRQDNDYSITLSAADGKLVNVVKHKNPTLKPPG